VRDYGIGFGQRVVLDPHGMPGASPLLAYTIHDGWGEHPAVHSLIMRPVSFVQVRELSVAEPAQPLVFVGEDAWAEANVDGFQTGVVPAFDAAVDRRGPIPVAAASERNGSRLIVIASDQLALNALLREDVAYDHGRDLILNALGGERAHIKVGLATNYLEVLKMLVKIGLGWSALPRTLIDAGLKVIHIENMRIERELGIVSHTARTLSTAAQRLIDIIRTTT